MNGIERHWMEEDLQQLIEQKRRISAECAPGVGYSLARVYGRIIELRRRLEA